MNGRKVVVPFSSALSVLCIVSFELFTSPCAHDVLLKRKAPSEMNLTGLTIVGSFKLYLEYPNLDGRRALLGVFDFKAHFVAFLDVVDKSTNVYEHVFATVFRGDKSETLRIVEEFNCSFNHCLAIFKEMK